MDYSIKQVRRVKWKLPLNENHLVVTVVPYTGILTLWPLGSTVVNRFLDGIKYYLLQIGNVIELSNDLYLPCISKKE